jgi:cation-transporting ATPase E
MTLWAKAAPRRGDVIPQLVRFVIPVATLTMIAGVALYAFHYDRVLAGLGNYEFRDRAIEAFEKATGLTFAAGDQFSTAAATIVAQSTLSIFITFTAFVLILFLAPPARFFTGWKRAVSADKRPLWLTIALTIVFVFVITLPETADYFGLIAVGPGIYISLAVCLIVWTIAVRSAWRHHWLERFLGLDWEVEPEPPDQAVRGK